MNIAQSRYFTGRNKQYFRIRYDDYGLLRGGAEHGALVFGGAGGS